MSTSFFLKSFFQGEVALCGVFKIIYMILCLITFMVMLNSLDMFVILICSN